MPRGNLAWFAVQSPIADSQPSSIWKTVGLPRLR